MSPQLVLTEDEGLEVLAYLVTAARTQVDEAAEYGPMRLLTAARRLADLMGPRTSAETQALLTGPLQQAPELSLSTTDPDGYAERLDNICRAVAQHLVVRLNLDQAAR
jgi:hypothetical protein